MKCRLFQYNQEGYNVLHIQYPGNISTQTLETARRQIEEQSVKEFGLITFGLLEADVNTLSAFCSSSAQLRAVIHYCPDVKTEELLGPRDKARASLT